MAVPIHVWQPPQLESTVGKTVAISKVIGPRETADLVEARLLEMAPADSGRETTFIQSESLQDKSEIQLVSWSDEEPNDVALASVARQEGIDYVLRGEVLENRIQRDGEDPLIVSWQLTSIAENRSAGGRPIVVETESAIDRYPDLAFASERESLLANAAVRDTFRLIVPWVERQRVDLAIPYFLPGSEEVRRGNAAALAGRWADAAQIWTEVAEKHPTQVAATHNLAIAAAAAQDFSRGKLLARKAIRRQPTKLHKETLVWIEQMQRRYHNSFNLPDPPEGWFVSAR